MPSLDGKITFRPLTEPDLTLLYRWLCEPHVVRFWRFQGDFAKAESVYRPRIEGKDPTRVVVIEYEGKSIGWIQWYRWADYPDHATQLGAGAGAAGLDLAIGEKSFVGIGIGSRALPLFVQEYIFSDPALTCVVADPEPENERSIGAFARAGFVEVDLVRLSGENFPRKIVRLDRSRPSHDS
jgi:aminoglycoside 6'-N-acetyltransferase